VTESDWWALCDADPGAFPWPYFADWLEERADPRADAAREAGRRLPVPRFHDYLSCWTWWLEGSAGPPGPDDLPPALFHALTGSVPAVPGADDECRDYLSASVACAALLDALARGRGAC
jgi:hypothetical protein